MFCPRKALGSSTKAWIRASILAVGMLAVSPSLAAGPSEQDKQAAQALLNRGNQLLGEGDYTAALEKFRAAYARYPSPRLMLNIGTTLRQLGRNTEAAEAYAQYLSSPEADPVRAGDVRRILTEIEGLLGRLSIRIEGPFDAVRLDGKMLEGFESGASIRVDVGEHTVVAEREGMPPAVQTVRVGPREERPVLVRFRAPVVKTVVVEKPVSNPRRTAGLVIGGVGVASLAASGAFGLIAKSQDNAADEHCMSPSACDARGVALGENALTSVTISTITFAGGAGLLATGTLLYLTAPSGKLNPSSGRAPVLVDAALGPQGALFLVKGLF
jgi:hypothetical protein